MSFESDMSRLDEIVGLLQKRGLSLEESLDLYKEGLDLTVKCKKALEQAKLTIKQMNEEQTDE